MSKTIVVGSCMVDINGYAPHLPLGGETAIGTEVKTGPGGKGSNQAVAAFLSGSETYLVACIGDDSASDVLKSFYAKIKMNTKYVHSKVGENTGTALIEIDTTNAQNRILIIRGANLSLSENDVIDAESDISDCNVILTQLEITDEPIIASAKMAKKYSKPFILNPAPYRPISDDLLSMIDYITPNETEAEYLTGVKILTVDDAHKACEILLAKGVSHVIITLGINGVYYSDGIESIHVPGIIVDAVDTTGAGDAFNGAFATALGEGKSIKQALQFANATAAISVTRHGAAPSMPSRKEIEDFILKVYPEY